MKSNILVIGGTGKTGRKVVEILNQRGHNVSVGSRKASPAFDWQNPSGWSQVLKGIEKMYIVFHPDLAIPGAFDAISQLMKAGLAAGVRKAVLLSGKGEKEAEHCEEAVRASGMDYVIVRASWFSQNFSESFLLDPILAGQVALPMSHVKIPFVDTTDIAEVVSEVLVNDAHNGKTYELTGPSLITFKEAIQTIEKNIDRKIGFTPVTIEEYNDTMKAAGLPDDYIWLIDYLFREVLTNPKNQVVTLDVERVLGRKATSFEDYVVKTIPTGVWNQNILQSI